MPLAPELENWLKSAPLSAAVKEQLAKEFEQEEAAKYARDSVLARADYSRAMDRNRSEHQQAMDKLKQDQQALSDLQAQLAGTGKGWSEEKKQLLAEIGGLKARIERGKAQFREYDVDGDRDKMIRELFGDDSTPVQRQEQQSSGPDLSGYMRREDYQKEMADHMRTMAGYYNWFHKTSRDHEKLFGTALDPDEMMNEVFANPKAPYNEVWDKKYGVSAKRQSIADAELEARAQKMAEERFQKMMTGSTLEGARRPDGAGFQNYTAKPTPMADGWDGAESKSNQQESRSNALKIWDEADGNG